MTAAEPQMGDTAIDAEYVRNVTGSTDLYERARDLIASARQSAYLAALPADLSALASALRGALGRNVRVVLFTRARFDLPGARVIVSPQLRDGNRRQVLPIIALVVDGAEALVGEQVGPEGMRGCWTQSRLLVSMIEHYLLQGGRHRFLVAEQSS
jgi:sugar-specific transcriptional regulator TrmB